MRNGILGSLATLALGAGMALGQSVPTLQQGLRLPAAGPGYGTAPVFPMSVPQASAPVYPVYPEQYAPMPQAAPSFPGEMDQPVPASAVNPVQVPQPAPGEFPVQVPGQPLAVRHDAADQDDWSRDADDGNFGPGPCPFRVWGSVEYLLWFVKPDLATPPLATTGPAGTAAIFGDPTTGVLIGQQKLDYQDQSGIRATVGFWFDKEGHIGAELTGFLLGEKSINHAVASDANGFPVIGRPVINAQTMGEASSLVSSPGQLAGFVHFDSGEQLYGGEVNFLGSIFRSKHFTADMLVGFRYLGLDEKLNVTSGTTVLPGGIAAFNGNVVAPGGSLTILDHFEARNDFYGGQVGGRAQLRWNRLFAEIQGKLAVGNAHEVVNINGGTQLSGTGGPAVLPGGLLAVASNSGIFSRDEFTFVPEGEVKVGFHVTDYISVFVGYTFIYWFDVARPSEQIDRTVNPALVPSNLAFGSGVGPNRPALAFNKTDFWAQGISLGLEVRY